MAVKGTNLLGLRAKHLDALSIILIGVTTSVLADLIFWYFEHGQQMNNTTTTNTIPPPI